MYYRLVNGAYQLYSDYNIGDSIEDEGIDIYERYSVLRVSKAGEYTPSAINRINGREKTLSGETIIVPAADIPVITDNGIYNVILDDLNNATISLSATGNGTLTY